MVEEEVEALEVVGVAVEASEEVAVGVEDSEEEEVVVEAEDSEVSRTQTQWLRPAVHSTQKVRTSVLEGAGKE